MVAQRALGSLIEPIPKVALAQGHLATHEFLVPVDQIRSDWNTTMDRLE